MSQEHINAKYAELCTELGHLYTQKHVIERQISALIELIKSVNDATPIILQAMSAQKGVSDVKKE